MISRLFVLLAVVIPASPQNQSSGIQELTGPDTITMGDSVQAAPVSPARAEIDRQLQADLLATFDRISGLGGVKANVEAGVIFLTGTALTAAEGALADSLARRMPGVLYVDNQIAVETSLRIRLRPVLGNLQDQALNGLALVPLLLVAGLVVLFFLFLARILYRREALFKRLGPNLFLSDLLRQIAAAGVALLGLFLALQLLDAAALVGAVLGAAGVAGIAVGFAFRNIAENYLAGIILSIRQPFFPNDQVLVEGQEERFYDSPPERPY